MNSPQNDMSVLAKGAGIALFGKIFGRALQLFLQILLARLLGPMQYGLYVFGYTVLQVGQQIGLLGLDNSLLHFGGKALQQNKGDLPVVLRTVQRLSLGSSLGVGLFVFLLASWFSVNIIRQPDLVNILRGFSIAIIFAAQLRVTSTITRLSQKTHYSVLSEDILPYFGSLGLVILFFYGFKLSIGGAIIAVVAGFGAGWTLAYFFTQRLSYSFPLVGIVPVERVKELFLFSFPVFLSIIFIYLLNGITIFMLGYFHSPEDVGVYQSAAQISTLSVVILLSFNAIFAPMISRLNQESQRPRLNELFKVSTKWALYASLPFLLILLLMPQQVLEILYGKNYVGGAWPLVILTIAQAINTGTGAVGWLLIMHRHQTRWLIFSGISLLMGVTLDIWLIPRWGMIGAALANASSVAILYLLALCQVRSLLGLWPYDQRYWKGLFAMGGSAVVIFGFLKLYPMQSVLQITGAFASSIAAFLFTLWLLKFDQEDMQILRSVFNQ